MKLVSIVSNTMRLDGGSMYGHVPKNLWEQWTPADRFNRIHIACRSLFLQTDEGRNILFDVGVGNFFDPKFNERYGVEDNLTLLKSLENIGIREQDIDTIILSHLHFDHAGGLLSAYHEQPPHLLFPNAHYYIGKTHWERARTPHLRERTSFIPTLISLLENSKRMVLLEESRHPDLNFGVTFTFSHGHTMGMLLSHLELPSGLLVYASDLVAALPWVHLPVTMGYDRYAELVVIEKEQLLKEMVAKKGRIFFTHDLNTTCAYINQDSQGKYVGEATLLNASII